MLWETGTPARRSIPSVVPLLSDTFSPLLRTERFGRPLRGTPETGSTNADAAAWAAEGAPEGAVVGADHQSAGRGRHGRVWNDAPGLGLLLSVVLRPAFAPERLGLIPLAAGLALADALTSWVAPAEPSLKWPNDVLLGNRKVAGVLAEGHLNGQTSVVVLGMGINVNQTDFPAALSDRATSLALESGRPLPRPPLLADLLAALEARYAALSTPSGAAATRIDFEARLAGRGRTATIAHASGTCSGEVLGVDASGALRLGTDGGVLTFAAGDVTLRAPTAA